MELISREAVIADRIEKQVKATRGVMKSCGIDKGDLETLELLTGHFLDMAADLRALPSQAPAVKVPPLKWADYGAYLRAETGWGPYLIREMTLYEVGFWWVYDYGFVNQDGEGICPYVDGEKCHTLAEAKAAAQADHEARILAALDLS